MKLYKWVFILVTFSVSGQTEQFASRSRYMQMDNPSFFGYNNLNRVGVLYNSIGVNSNEKVDNKYFYGSLSFDQLNFSLGLELNALGIQSNGLSKTVVNLAYVYKIQLSNTTYFLPAINLGFGSANVNINDFIFEDQLNATTGFINTETIDPLGSRLNNVNYFDLGASFIIHSDRMMTGLSFKHLNRPNTSFNQERESRLPLLISLQGGYELDLNPYDMRTLPRHSFLYIYGVVNRTPRTVVINLSQEIQMGPIAFGVSQQASKNEQFALNNIGVSASFSVENFDFGLQYNFPFRKQAQVYAPSLFELFVSFNFTAFRRNNRGFFKRLQIDNYF